MPYASSNLFKLNNLGPDYDHTTGGIISSNYYTIIINKLNIEDLFGYYGLCDGSLLTSETDTCELKKSVTLESDIDYQFYYYMYGRQIGTLMLSLNNTVIWSLSDSQMDEWLLGQVFIPQGTHEVRRIFVVHLSE